MVKTSIGHADVTERTEYTCDDCHMVERGDTRRIEYDSWEAMCNPPTPSNSYMPVGWSCDGLYCHRCPSCTHKRNEVYING